MTSFNLELSGFILLFATLFTGLSAGLCFTWTNAVTPGIGKLSDLNYLLAFQQMNRSIINPLFLLVFMGPTLLNGLAAYFHKASSAPIMWLLVAAALLYIIGVIIVTFIGNIPLNEILENTDLSNSNGTAIQSLRERFETKWNNFHLIRTISSTGSLLLLVMACILK